MREMKDSGFEWIGEIPVNWEVDKLKFHLKRNEPRNPGDTVVLSLYRELGVIPKDSRDDNHNVTSEDTSKYKYVQPGDFVINKMKAWQGSVAVSEYEGIVSPAYFIYKFTDDAFYRRYFHYLLRSCYKDEFMRLSGGIRVGQWDLPSVALDNTAVIIPPMNEQKSIAAFLDVKCAEIDALTADIQTQIDILEQYKRSVITEAVTKGLNPDAEMKDSGIDGAGMIPSHWKTTRLCYECYIRARLGWRGLKADEYVDDGYAFISAFNIQNGKLVWAPLNYITKERFDESPEIKLHKGDVLIVKDGAGVGKCARVDDLPIGGTAPNSSIAVITPNESQDYRYVCYYLQSAVFNNFVLLLYNGMGVPHLTQEVMSKIKILVPPLKEQMEISDYLDAKCTEIDAIVEAKKTQHATLDDYKKSLIYEYVTGKKEVPENA